jgi:4-amino-4-deoxy-L-arabinose transferase-like glycosyltransferase
MPPALEGETEIIDEPMLSAKHSLWAAGILLILSVIVLFYGLGRLPLLGPDEPRYAEVAREMLVSGDLISPRLCGCLWFEKPVLLYWMAALGYKGFGVGELGARFLCAVAAVLTVWFLNFAGSKTAGSRAGFASGIVLLTSPLFIGFGRAAVTDMPLTWAMAMSLLLLLLSVNSTGRRELALWTASWAMVGVAVLAKGLVGIVLFVAIAGSAYLLSRTPRLPSVGRLLLGIAVSTAIAGIWYGPVILEHGRAFTTEFFVNHHFKRYLTNEYHHPEAIYFYPAVLVLGILPWSAFLVPALAGFRNSARQQGAGARFLHWLLWSWLVIPLLFFSFSESKLPGYILPAMPALAMIIGLELKKFWEGQSTPVLRMAAYATSITAMSIGAGLIIYLRAQLQPGAGLAAVMEYLPLGLALGGTVMLFAGRAKLFLIGTAAVVPSVILAGLILLLPQLSWSLSMRELSIKAFDSLRPGEKIAFFIDREYAPVFYAQGRVVCGGRGNDVLNAMSTDELVTALDTYPSLIVLTDYKWLNALTADHRMRFEQIGQQKDQFAVRIELSPTASSAPIAIARRPLRGPADSSGRGLLSLGDPSGVQRIVAPWVRVDCSGPGGLARRMRAAPGPGRGLLSFRRPLPGSSGSSGRRIIWKPERRPRSR